MRIYKAEKEAGIESKMNERGNSSLFVTAQLKAPTIKEYFGMSIADLIKSTDTVQTVEQLTGQEQPDLALVVAILVSTGWNDNDDIFTPTEVWKARLSALHKPMNDNHNGEKILGHIIQSRALDKSGNELVILEGESPPDKFDIEVAGVLYRQIPELKDRIDEIITKAKAGEIFVSMEAWFPNFGYGFMDSDNGNTKLVERTEATAFLTKHLKVYGGSGEYQGRRVGRVLKEIIFSAQGFVDKPANPESVIKVAANKGSSFVTADLNEFLKEEGGGEDMENEKKVKELEDSLAAKIQEIVELRKSADEIKAKEYDEQIVILKTQVDELTIGATEATNKIKTLEVEKSELQKNLDETTVRIEKSESELDGIQKDGIARDRLAKLSKIQDIKDEKATLAELRDMSDETFAVVIKYAGETKVEDKKDDDGSEAAKAALDSVKEKEKETADLITNEDAKASETENWAGLGLTLLNRKEKGGE